MSFEPRWKSGLGVWGWILWLIPAVALTIPPFLWHLEYFKKAGPGYYRLIVVLTAALAVVVFFYRLPRRKVLWRYEPLALAGLVLAVCLFYQPVAVLVAVWFFTACYAAGRFCIEKLAIEPRSRAAGLALATAVGLGLATCLLFVAGLLHGYRGWLFAVVLAAPCLLLHRQEAVKKSRTVTSAGRERPWRRHGHAALLAVFRFLHRFQVSLLISEVRGLYRVWLATAGINQPVMGVVVVFAPIFTALTVMVALTPTIGADAARDHLPAIQHYARTHALVPVPGVDYSYMPQAVEILLTPAYVLAGQSGAQMVLPGFFVLALLMAYAVARRCGIGGMPAIAGSLLGGATPFLHWSGSIFKNDLALALFLLGSLYCYLCGRESDNPNWLRLGAFLLAMAFGVKHVAIFGGIPLGLLYLHALWARPRRWRRAAEVAAIVVGLGLVWQVRAFLLIGNPFHPYSVETAVEKWQPMEGSGRPSTFLLYAQYPWIVHFEGRRSFENPSSNPAGIFLVLFWPLWLFWRRRSGGHGERACLFLAAVYYLYWGYIWGVLRYFIVPFLLLVSFTAARLLRSHEHAGRMVRGTIQAAIAYSLLFAMLVTVPIEANPTQLRFLAGKLNRDAYLREAIVGFRSLEYLAGRVKPQERILAVGNCFRGYAPTAASYDCIDVQRVGLARERLQQRLHANEYAFLIVPVGWRQELVPPAGGGYEAKAEYEDEAFVVYSLRPRTVPGGT